MTRDQAINQMAKAGALLCGWAVYEMYGFWGLQALTCRDRQVKLWIRMFAAVYSKRKNKARKP